MNLNDSARVYEQESKYEYSHMCWYEFDCESEWESYYEYTVEAR